MLRLKQQNGSRRNVDAFREHAAAQELQDEEAARCSAAPLLLRTRKSTYTRSLRSNFAEFPQLIPQLLVIFFHYIKANFQYVTERFSSAHGHGLTVWANIEIVRKRMVDGRSQSHVHCTVGNGSKKQREELSHIHVAGKASPQCVCVATNVTLNGFNLVVL